MFLEELFLENNTVNEEINEDTDLDLFSEALIKSNIAPLENI